MWCCTVVLHLSHVWEIDVGHEPDIHSCDYDVAYSRYIKMSLLTRCCHFKTIANSCFFDEVNVWIEKGLDFS